MEDPRDSARALLEQGLSHTHEGRFGEAGLALLRAVEILTARTDRADCLKDLGHLADHCQFAGHPDLALMTLGPLLASPERRSNPRRHSSDLLCLANCWTRLGRPDRSVTLQKRALAHALEHGQYADAASASTNLASLAGARGCLKEALKRLEASLSYLEKESNADTDALTRLCYLHQVADALKVDPARALELSADLFTRLKPFVGPDRWQSIAPAFHRLVERHLAAHPEIDADTWRRETFPLVFVDPPQ